MDRIGELRAAFDSSREALFATMDGLSDQDWDTPVQSEGEGWTVRHVITHLLDTEQSQMMLMHRLRGGEETVPADFDIDRWNRRVKKMEPKPADELRAGLEQSRAVFGSLLDQITPEDLTLTGRHPALGEDVTLERFLELLAWHESHHTKEITDGLNA
jgi:uncharacterized damage-inducible protein DinB